MTRRLRVRQSQTVVPFGVGAILDTQGESFVAADITYWPGRRVPIECRQLADRLKTTGFFAAPAAPNDSFDSLKAAGVPYVRFPSWLFCGGCRRMVRWNLHLERPGTPPSCSSCTPRHPLTPMRFVQICADGHMDDVDWWRWAHSGRNAGDGTCDRAASSGRLRFLVDPASTGLEALSIECASCGTRRGLLRLLDSTQTRCTGRHPWRPRKEAVECPERARIVQRNAGNLYYPVVHSALDIPAASPDSGLDAGVDPQVAARIRADDLWTALCQNLESPRAPVLISLIADSADATAEQVEALLRVERSGTGEQSDAPSPAATDSLPPAAALSWDEWAALTASEPPRSRDFVVREVGLLASPEPGGRSSLSGSERLLSARISRVVVADRLREVRVLQGFNRVAPRSSFVPVDPSRRLRWLPAVEVFGEGVFLAFDEEELASWEALPQVRDRVAETARELDRAFQKERLAGATGGRLLPRMPLLHTFAHLLIRQFAFECGYGIASLRERVYARPSPGEGRHQAGVLVYAAAGDADGTLGGLVHQGGPPHLAEILLRLLEAGAWCSADPLCAEHGAQGFGNLNRAACHACVLLPETSCETGNTLLDRVLLVGGSDVPGFFEPVLRAAHDEAARASLALEGDGFLDR